MSDRTKTRSRPNESLITPKLKIERELKEILRSKNLLREFRRAKKFSAEIAFGPHSLNIHKTDRFLEITPNPNSLHKIPPVQSCRLLVTPNQRWIPYSINLHDQESRFAIRISQNTGSIFFDPTALREQAHALNQWTENHLVIDRINRLRRWIEKNQRLKSLYRIYLNLHRRISFYRRKATKKA
jgi:hypothetical protein